MNDVTKDLLEALSYVIDAWIDGNGSEWNQSDSAAQARAAIARAEAALAEPDSLHADEPVAAWSDEDRARLRKALDAALQRPPARDDVIRMAREAGFTRRNPHCDLMVIHSNGSWVGIEDELTRLIAIVAAEEREACLRCYSPDDTAADWADKIRARGQG